MKVFWDTNLFIYLIEQHPIFQSKVHALYERQRSQNEKIATSMLTLGELLTQPLRHGHSDLAHQYIDLLTSGSTIELIPFDRPAAEHYAVIRAQSSIRQPDAIQLACAAAHQVEVFYTNDRNLWDIRVPGIKSIRGL